MATIADLKRALIAADKAGDLEAAGVFANEIKKAQAQGLSDTSTFLPPKAKKERPIGEKIVGAGETALGVLGGGLAGAAGQVVGTAKGLGETIVAGEFGTQKGAERVQQEAQQTAGQFAQPFMPRTEAGQEYIGDIAREAAVLQYMNPMLAETAAIANLAKAARPQATVITAPARQAAGRAVQAIPTPKLSPTIAPGVAQAAKSAEELGINVMTSDIVQPQTFIGKSAQMATERIPLAGTGGMRETQQAQRVQAIKNVVSDYKADSPLNSMEETVMQNLAKSRGDEIAKYAQLKRDVFDRMGNEPVSTPKANVIIDQKISELSGLNSKEVEPVIAYLQDFKNTINSGLDIKQIEGNRKLLGEKFKSPDLASVKSAGERATNAVYGALREDMGDHIKQFGERRDYTKWNVANRKLSDMSEELEISALKSSLKKAETQPEEITKLLYSKKPSEVNVLYRNLPPEGRQNARSAILGKIYQDSLDANGEVSTAKFLSSIDKMDNNVKVFFTGADKAKLDGLKKALTLTRRAETANLMTPTGQQLYAIGGIGAGIATGLPGLFGMGTVGLIARAYESAPMRNALIKMSKAKTRSEQIAAMEKIGEALKEKSGKF